jgi:hypothetical protein
MAGRSRIGLSKSLSHVRRDDLASGNSRRRLRTYVPKYLLGVLFDGHMHALMTSVVQGYKPYGEIIVVIWTSEMTPSTWSRCDLRSNGPGHMDRSCAGSAGSTRAVIMVRVIRDRVFNEE